MPKRSLFAELTEGLWELRNERSPISREDFIKEYLGVFDNPVEIPNDIKTSDQFVEWVKSKTHDTPNI